MRPRETNLTPPSEVQPKLAGRARPGDVRGFRRRGIGEKLYPWNGPTLGRSCRGANERVLRLRPSVARGLDGGRTASQVSIRSAA